MKRVIIGTYLALTVACACHADDKTTMALEANRGELYLGESLILRVTVSGPGRDAQPDLSQVRNCDIELLGSRDISEHRVTIVNGRMTRKASVTRVFSYRLTPHSPGMLQAGPVTLSVAPERLELDGPMVEVKEIDRQDMVSIRISSSHETALVDEPFDITLEVLIRGLDGEYSHVQPLFPDNPPNLKIPYLDTIPGLEGPDINSILNDLLVDRPDRAGIGINNISRRDPVDLLGFFHQPRAAKFAMNPRIVEEDGKSYVKYSLSLRFTPVEEGDYVFGPAVFQGPVLVEFDERGKPKGTDIFAVGHARTVRITPPPEEGRPLSFSGAIGERMEVQASLDEWECNVGDPLKLTLTVSGDVRLGNMLPPRLSLQADLSENFTLYDRTVETIRQDDRHQYIYTLRPTSPGPLELPPIEVSYFDTRERTYKTISTEPIPLLIHEAPEISVAKIIPDEHMRRDALVEAVPAGMRTDDSGSDPASLTGNVYIIGMIAGAGPLFYAMAMIGQFVVIRRQSWKTSSRRQRAAVIAISALKGMKPLDQSEPEQSRAELYGIVRRYLADRFQQPAASFTPGDIQERLRALQIDRQAAAEFCAVFETLFNAGFSSFSPADVEAARNDLLNIIPRLENKTAKLTGASDDS